MVELVAVQIFPLAQVDRVYPGALEAGDDLTERALGNLPPTCGMSDAEFHPGAWDAIPTPLVGLTVKGH
ncbi:hypothetical protein [Streptomyces sp. NBC_01296]|uniref:hypothetical protein n=1 Tax=Streptomyces sp. NBC_01296 TaxID=2903816 RepID=UPI002E14D7C9|nr:hypothetical protein OG299_01700 [Streptomyces sp. NBC_01296]